MKTILLSPVVAFLIYFVSGVGCLRAWENYSPHRGRKSEFKSATYASGEENDPFPPRRDIVSSLWSHCFLRVLHLGVLMIGSSDLSSVAGLYLLGLILALIALILG